MLPDLKLFYFWENKFQDLQRNKPGGQAFIAIAVT